MTPSPDKPPLEESQTATAFPSDRPLEPEAPEDPTNPGEPEPLDSPEESWWQQLWRELSGDRLEDEDGEEEGDPEGPPPQPLWRRLLPDLEEYHEHPDPEPEPPAPEPTIPLEPLYPKYACGLGNPLHCDQPQAALEQDPPAISCGHCGFPAPIPSKRRLQGGTFEYEVGAPLPPRGRSRVYGGDRLPDHQEVSIQEYLLPQRYFTPQQILENHRQFRDLAQLSLADGRSLDFRLIFPQDTITDLRTGNCYLITPGTWHHHPTLKQHLQTQGAMEEGEVQRVIQQVLQSLEFLHNLKFRIGSGQVQRGLVHGELNLESLIVVPQESTFLIYLCDLSLWSRLFDPLVVAPERSKVTDDLAALGQVAFYLLRGTTCDRQTLQPLDPLDLAQWPPISDSFRDFLINLMGLGVESYGSAAAARQAFKKLPPRPPVVSLAQKKQGETLGEQAIAGDRKRFWGLSVNVLLALGGVLGLVAITLLVWWLVLRYRRSPVVAPLENCCVEGVAFNQGGKFTAVKNSPWDFAWMRENLVAKGVTLRQRLETQQPQLQLLEYESQETSDQVLDQVRSGAVDFAMVSDPYNQIQQMDYQIVAYDALAVFVPFATSQNPQSLPGSLGGKISLGDLAGIYRGQITNWQDLGGPDLAIKPHIPHNEELIQIFEERVLREPEAIADFRRLFPPAQRSPQSTYGTLRSMLQDFEEPDPQNRLGGIGFDSLSKIFGQCAVYPLALQGDGPGISPLVLTRNPAQAISPDTALCDNKGSYGVNRQALRQQRYPLTYPLAIAYPWDNRRPPVGENFAQILRTEEAQRLLEKIGFAPYHELPPPSAENTP